MVEFIHSVLAAVHVFLRSGGDNALEILTLRQQVAVPKRKRPRPHLNRLDRFLRTTLHRVWSRWAEVLAKCAKMRLDLAPGEGFDPPLRFH